MSRHLAGLAAENPQRWVVCCLIGWSVLSLVLYPFTTLSLYGAFIVAALIVLVALCPLLLLRRLAKKIEADALEAEQLAQLAAHRAKKSHD